MKPGHIRVFDGLRVTTEHIDHLQGSFHSAIEDIRSVIGLDQVFSGFGVVKEGDNAIIVRPGLAFDAAKNRIVCDDPKTLDVSFETGEEQKFVCVKYQQIEDGFVEERPTLIWDACSLLIRTSQPDPNENLVVVAILARQDDGDAFEIITPLSSNEKQEDKAINEDAENEEKATKQRTEDREGNEPVAKPIITNGTQDSREDNPEIFDNTDLVEVPSSDEIASAESSGRSELLAATSPQARLQVMQGILRLEGNQQEAYLGTLVLESLKQQSESGSNSGRDEQLRFMLDEKEIALDFVPTSLTFQTIIDATFKSIDNPALAGAVPEEETGTAESDLTFQTTAQGEATFNESDVSQFGMSTVRAHSSVESGNSHLCSSDLTEKGIALVKFSAFFEAPENDGSSMISEILQHVELLVTVDERLGRGFSMSCKLFWIGGATKELIENIERQSVRFMWKSVVAWKAMGDQYR